MTEYHVGQTLIRRDVNERRTGGPQEVIVSKVGRKLVTVTHYGRPETYRIEDGTRNDEWKHHWIQTPEQYAEDQRQGAVEVRLRELGVDIRFGTRYSTDVLEQIVDLLVADTEKGN